MRNLIIFIGGAALAAYIFGRRTGRIVTKTKSTEQGSVNK